MNQWSGEMGERTKAELSAWLDGYRAAAETAKTFEVRVGASAVDGPLNQGAQMVACLLASQVKRFESGER